MDVKDFERYLELAELKKEFDSTNKDWQAQFPFKKEFYDLKQELENLLFSTQENYEKIIFGLKDLLSNFGKVKYGLYDKPNEIMNEVKALKEILSLLDTYDWKLMYSEHDLDGSGVNKQVAVWEQNHDNQIRNYKVWSISNSKDVMSFDSNGNMSMDGSIAVTDK